MKHMMLALVFAGLMAAFSAPVFAAGPVNSSVQTQPKPKKQRAQVLGMGKSLGLSVSDAFANAAKVAGTYSFTKISQTTSGKGENWTCMMIIEYEMK